MRLVNARALERYLEQMPTAAQLYWIASQDSVQQDKILERIVVAQQLQAAALIRLEGGELTPARLGEELESRSLLTAAAVLHCRHADKLSAACQQVIVSYCKRPRTDLLVILAGASGKGSAAKAVEQVGVVVDLTTVPPWEQERTLAIWLEEECRRQGKWIAPAAAQRLIALVGADCGLLGQELEKLLCYIGERNSLTTEDVEALVRAHPRQRGWELGQAVLERSPARALTLVAQLLHQGDVAPHALLAQLRSQFNTAFQLCSLADRGLSQTEVAHCFPQLKGKRLERDLNRARGYGSSAFKQAIAVLAEADLRSKSQTLSMRLLLERTVSQLACL